MSDSLLHQQLDAFTEHLTVARQLSARTVESLRQDCLALLSWCAEQQVSRLDQLTGQQLPAYLHHRQQQGLTDREQQRTLSSIRRFFEFAVHKRWLTDNPIAGIGPHQQRGQPLEDDWFEQRDETIRTLFTTTGLRFAELVNLNLDDVDMIDGSLHVLGNGRSGRVLTLDRPTLKTLQQWLAVRAQCAAPDNPALFISQRGTRLAARSIQDRFQRLSPVTGTAHRPAAGLRRPATEPAQRRTTRRPGLYSPRHRADNEQ